MRVFKVGFGKNQEAKEAKTMTRLVMWMIFICSISIFNALLSILLFLHENAMQCTLETGTYIHEKWLSFNFQRLFHGKNVSVVLFWTISFSQRWCNKNPYRFRRQNPKLFIRFAIMIAYHIERIFIPHNFFFQSEQQIIKIWFGNEQQNKRFRTHFSAL